MPLIKEILSEEDIKKLAAFLKIENAKETLEKLSIDNVITRLENAIKYLEEIEEEQKVSEAKALKGKLDNMDDADWQASLGNVVSYPVIKEPNSANETLLQLHGTLQQQKELVQQLKTAYKDITNKEAQEVYYENADPLPKNLEKFKENFSQQASFTIITFAFTNLEHYEAFNLLVMRLENEGKVSRIGIETAPQELSNAHMRFTI